MKCVRLILSLSTLLGLAGQMAQAGSNPVQTDPAPLPRGKVWELQSLTVNGKTQTPPQALNRPTISFDGRSASGNTFCNSYHASYVSRADVLRFSPAVTTRKACRSTLGTIETQFLNLLAGTSRYIVSGANLTLYSGSRGRLLFVLQGQPAATAVTPRAPSPVQPMMVNPAPAMTQKGLPPASTIFDRASSVLGLDEQLMVVGPQQATCTGVVPQRCLLVKAPAEQEWSVFYGQIEGFRFQPGTITLIRVKIERLSRPAADGSTVSYRLVRVLGTQKV